MTAALLDALLAGFAMPTPAKAANPANREHPCGAEADSGRCEGLPSVANSGHARRAAGLDSQAFAGVRNPCGIPGSKEWRGFSQDSQDSQGCPPANLSYSVADLAAVEWTDADMARFMDRRARLMRWGWAEAEAERQAEKLVLRDGEADARVSCTECEHYRPGRCSNHRRAGLLAPDVGRHLAELMQHCEGYSGSSGQTSGSGNHEIRF